MTNCIIFDLDGTLFDCNHRRHHIRNGKRDWKAFFAEIPNDPVIEPVAELARMLGKITTIICCSGRGEETRFDSENQLISANIPYTKLYMRPLNDTREDHVIKLELLQQMRADGYDPLLVVDDRASVVQAWRQNGLTCLQCCDFDESKAQAGAQLDIMVGPSGAGKSTWIKDSIACGDIVEGSVISSDELRYELCGDFKVQTRNDDVFAAMSAIARTRLAHGLSVVLDATHLRTKDRVAAAKLGIPNCKVNYWVINRPIEDKLRDRDWRSEELITRQENTFNSNLKAILAGDGLGVNVIDLRKLK